MAIHQTRNTQSRSREALPLRLYAELGRYTNPSPILMIYIPHLLGYLLAIYDRASVTISSRHFYSDTLLLLSSAALLHGFGCSWNDFVDADIDQLVARTRKRPIARGAISQPHAVAFAMVQILAWLANLRAISPRAATWAFPLIPGVLLYPYAKRSIPVPSVMLGAVLSYGVFLGYASAFPVHIGPPTGNGDNVRLSLLYLFAAYTCFVSSIDMIYAHQDLKDDLRANVKSMAVTFRLFPKLALIGLAAMQNACLLSVGWLMPFGTYYYTIACAGTLVGNIMMVWQVDLEKSASCFWWWQTGTLSHGLALLLGVGCELLLHG
ncbi:UbiA prenyltransferase [Xylariomycetidae sp. FL2044]|nr:UbiA prenyltransferase [Xylariomycetidae sp. FL2044]